MVVLGAPCNQVFWRPHERTAAPARPPTLLVYRDFVSEPVPVPDDPGSEPLGALVVSEMQSGRVMPGGHGCRLPDIPVLRSLEPDWPDPGEVERPDGLPLGFEVLPSREVEPLEVEPPVEPPGELPVVPDEPLVAPDDGAPVPLPEEPLLVCADAVLTRSNDVAAMAMLAFKTMGDLLL